MFSKWATGSANGEWNIRYRDDEQLHFWYYGSSAHTFLSSQSLSDNYWQYLTFVYTWGTGSSAKWYINGTEDTGSSWSSGNGNDGFNDIATTTVIAAGDEGTANYYDGTFDELRVSKVVRTASWINTGYNTMTNTTTFVSYGTEVSQS